MKNFLILLIMTSSFTKPSFTHDEEKTYGNFAETIMQRTAPSAILYMTGDKETALAMSKALANYVYIRDQTDGSDSLQNLAYIVGKFTQARLNKTIETWGQKSRNYFYDPFINTVLYDCYALASVFEFFTDPRRADFDKSGAPKNIKAAEKSLIDFCDQFRKSPQTYYSFAKIFSKNVGEDKLVKVLALANKNRPAWDAPKSSKGYEPYTKAWWNELINTPLPFEFRKVKVNATTSACEVWLNGKFKNTTELILNLPLNIPQTISIKKSPLKSFDTSFTIDAQGPIINMLGHLK
ncbi:MAG: hypothetical protein WCF67_08975 [Chitinophagaceae bacterium]